MERPSQDIFRNLFTSPQAGKEKQKQKRKEENKEQKTEGRLKRRREKSDFSRLSGACCRHSGRFES